MDKRILIIGASGTGTTTLGKRISTQLEIPFIDLDELFWIESEIPFTKFRNAEQLREIVNDKIYSNNEWLISGDPSLWNVGIEDKINYLIFLKAPADIRITRLEQRYDNQYGIASRVKGNLIFENHQRFIKWTMQYDTGGITGRTKNKQESWISNLNCIIFETNSDKDLGSLTENALKIIV